MRIPVSKRIVTGSNRTNVTRNATRHAEMEAIDALSETMTEVDLSDCTLFVTCEPCIMCASALSLVKIGWIVTALFSSSRCLFSQGGCTTDAQMKDLVGVGQYWMSIRVVFAALVVPFSVRNIFINLMAV